MPTSEKQIEPNRQNAQKSTGTKSSSGTSEPGSNAVQKLKYEHSNPFPGEPL
jgi:hypothetical protein